MTGLTIRRAIFENGVACVTLDGVLDAWTSPGLEAEIIGLMEAGTVRLAFDLERLRMMTSAGAGVFLGATMMAHERGGAVSLARPTPTVRQILEVLGLDRVFVIEDDCVLAAQALALRGTSPTLPASA